VDFCAVPATDLRLSRLVLGTMTFGDTVDADTAAAMLSIAEEAGITMLDTANGYAGGAAEKILGDLLTGRRERFLLASKVGIPHPDADGEPPLSRGAIRRCLDGTLRRLRTDHLDVYYLHQPDRQTPIEETLDELAAQVAAGRVRHVGLSNFAAWQISETRRVAERMGGPLPVLSQVLYNLVGRGIEAEYAEYATTTGLRTVTYNPLAGGLLTGRHRYGRVPGTGRFGTSRLSEMYRNRYWDSALFDATRRLSLVADEAGLSLPELAFRWLLSQPVTSAVLLGASNPAQLTANLVACAGGPLPPETLKSCDEVWLGLRGPAPAYNR